MQSMIIDDTKIGYQFEKGKYDRQHLIVIFSGFRKKGTFDFQGKALSKLTASILWIDDCFDGKYTYYMFHRRGKDLSETVNKLIKLKLQELHLEADQCTLAGFSKGGTAALYYAAKFGYKNVVATVPQFSVGRYITSAWRECIISMTPSGSTQDLEALDGILANEIKNSDSEKNIYLFTSPADTQYQTEILPNLALMRKYTNFNLVTSETPLITKHNQVTKYNVPGILAVLSLLAEGISPRLGEVENGVGQPESISSAHKSKDLGKLQASIGKAFIRNGRLFLTGYALYENHVSDAWGSQKMWLEIVNSHEVLNVPLGQICDETVNGKFYQEPYVNHSHASFATIGHKGVNITNLIDGNYKLGMTVEAVSRKETTSQLSGSEFDEIYYHNGRVYRLKKTKTDLILSIFSFSQVKNSSCYFDAQQNEVIDGKLFIKGYLVPEGIDVSDWKSIRYFVELSETSGNERIYIPAACDHKSDISTRTGNYFNDQSKAYYASKGYKGIDLSSIPAGEYAARIIGIASERIFASPTLELQLSIEKERLENVDIIGSCVSRDIFNSRIIPKWRNNFSLGNQAFQSSLISLVSDARSLEPEKLKDLDKHDFQNVIQDFAKDYVKKFDERAPDIILVDFFTDSRFGVIGDGDSWITDNSWKLGKSEYYKELTEQTHISMWTNESEYTALFRRACELFRDLVAKHAPNAKIIVNQTRCVTHHRANGITKAFSRKYVEQQNLYWDKLEKIFISLVPCESISVDFSDITGDSNHIWGPGPVHYEKEYYDALHRELIAKTRINM